MPDREFRNAILCLQLIAEKGLNQQQKLFIRFIDFVKAFDKVQHSELLDALDGTGIDDNDLRFLLFSYWKQIAAVKVGLSTLCGVATALQHLQ